MMRNPRHTRLTRPSDAFLPVALLAAALLNPSTVPALFFACYCALSLLSLFSGSALRIAFAAQPALRGVRGNAKCALLLQAASLPAALLIAWPLGLLKTIAIPAFLCAGCLYNIEHTFYEYLFAVGDGFSATLCEALSALFLLTGLCLSGDAAAAFQPAILPTAAALSALVAAIISLAQGGFSRGKLQAQVIAAAPRAAVQALLYPL